MQSYLIFDTIFFFAETEFQLGEGAKLGLEGAVAPPAP